MVAKLTPEQREQLSIYAEKWQKIGLSTAPANHTKAGEGVHNAYTAVGLTPPEKITWHQSPFAILLDAKQYNPPLTSRWSSAWTIRYYETMSRLNKIVTGDSGNDFQWNTVRNDVLHGVEYIVQDRVWTPIGKLIQAELEDSFRFQATSGEFFNIWTRLTKSSLGGLSFIQHTADKHGFFNYFDEILNISCEDMHGLWQVAQHAGWWLPCEDLCFLSERPTTLHLDSDGKPHCEDDMAITYSDGWGVYAWHGLHVPEIIIRHPDKITTEQIEAETDPAIKQLMVERKNK